MAELLQTPSCEAIHIAHEELWNPCFQCVTKSDILAQLPLLHMTHANSEH